MTAPPVMYLDPFTDDFWRAPERHYETLRERGPTLLDPHGVWAVARHADVSAVLRDHDAFCSSAGVGLANFHTEKPWRSPSLLLETDPPEHTKVRRVIARVLSPRTIDSLRPLFERYAEELVSEIVERGEVDGVTELAEAYPLRVFPDAVGIGPDGRENLLLYGDMVFNAFGPRNQLFEQALAAATPVVGWITERCQRDSLEPGGLGAEIYAAADRGEIDEEEAGLLVRSLLSAGIDTTVHGLAWSLHLLATHPRQWSALRDDPGLARPAFEETLRYASPVSFVFRTTTREVSLAGNTLPAEQKVLCFTGAANRDPQRWRDPDRFNIRRHGITHLGFGFGIHACVGAAIARLEAQVLLTTLARRVRDLEPAGPPQPRPNNALRTLASLPLRATPT